MSVFNGPVHTNELVIFLFLGILGLSASFLSLLWNRDAFFHISDNSVKAKYHLFGKIDCRLSDVEFVSAKINILIVQLKNGKCHTISGVKNSWELCRELRRKMSFEPAKSQEELIEKLSKLKADKKEKLIYCCCSTALLFVNIFIAVFLTDGREMYEFSKTDWIVFAVLGVLEIATLVAMSCFALKAGKNNIPIEKTEYTIRRTIIETAPLLPGFVTAAYADGDYICRITVFGYPHKSDIYYSVQKVSPEYNLVREYTSDIYDYDSQEDIPYDFQAFIDITEKVLH